MGSGSGSAEGQKEKSLRGRSPKEGRVEAAGAWLLWMSGPTPQVPPPRGPDASIH